MMQAVGQNSAALSWRPEFDRSKRSLYLELASCLERDIAAGVLRPGAKLPPQRELADTLGVNVSTVSKAFKLCELKGLLSATVGSGTFVAYSALTGRELLQRPRGKRVIDMAQALPDDSANHVLAQMASELFKSGEADALFSFHAQGEDEWQKDAAVKLMELCGHATHRDRILFANGGQNALSAILASLFPRGGKLAVDDHTYPGVRSAAAMFGVKLVPVRTGAQGMDPADLARVCRTEKITGAYLISACHNPTTATMPEENRREIARVLREADALLIEDGTYQLMHGGARAVADFAPERSLYIATLSKVIAPGMRAACVSSPEACKARVSDALYSLNVGVVPLMAELGARVIASGQFEGITAAHRAETARRSAVVRGFLPDSVCAGGDADIYRWLSLPEKYTSAQFERLALERGVGVLAAERFTAGKTPPARAARVAFCTPKSNEELIRGLRILSRLLKE
ncbi:MAG: PLP-dependent aminotransferase family protein [Pyramidobacter sp.]|nr:PLP-dependent aminotransferase family protein [Pyramidobacter sp.]